MRHFKNFMILIMTITAITFSSCSSDDDSGDGGGGGGAAEGTLTAKIGGANFTSEALATSAVIVTSGAGRALNIIAGDFNGKTITIGIPIYEGDDMTYDMDSEGVFLNVLTLIDVDVSNPQSPVSQTWLAPFAGSNIAGSVSIDSETATHVVGTFTMTVKGGDNDSIINITEGSFNIELQ